MELSLDKWNIYFVKDPTKFKDEEFIRIFKPYQLARNSIKYKAPITPTSLIFIMKYWNINNELWNQRTFEASLDVEYSTFIKLFSTNKELRPYQEQGILWAKETLNKYNGCGFFWAPRTGKTRATVFTTKDYNKILVLSLSGQEANWETTFNQYGRKDTINIHNCSVSARKSKYDIWNNMNRSILIGSINTLTQDILNEKFNPNSFDIIIVDEAHRIKNNKTKLRKGADKLRSLAVNAFILTGTPVSKEANEITSLFSFICPHAFSKTYLQDYFFEKERNFFSKYKYSVSGVIKQQKEQEWLEFLSTFFSQVKKEQALTWAKEPLITPIRLKMEGQQLKAYERCLLDKSILTSKGVFELGCTVQQLTFLREIGVHPKLVDTKGESVKEQWLFEYLSNDIETDGIIIFSVFTSYLNSLKYELELKNYKVGMITGETKDKFKVANDFQNGVYDIILANIDAGSEGITLDKADTMIFLDEDWRPEKNLQAIERFTPITPDRIKPREVIRLMIDYSVVVEGKSISSMDDYIRMVNENKLTQTEIINEFKNIFNWRKENF